MSFPRRPELAETDPKKPQPHEPEATAPDVESLPMYVDADVVTADGASLGPVAELTQQHFRIDRSMMPDIWIERARVAESTEQRACLDIDKADIDAYALDRPPVVDDMLSDEEHARQRSSMERELEAQREEREDGEDR